MRRITGVLIRGVVFSGLALLTFAEGAWAAPLSRFSARVHCYTELVNLPTATLALTASDPDVSTGRYRAEGTVGHLGDIELYAFLTVEVREGSLGLCSSSLSVIRETPEWQAGSGAIRSADAQDCLGLPPSNSFVLGVANGILAPYDPDPDVSCRIQIIAPTRK